MKDTIQIRMYDNCEDKMKKISIVLPVYNGAKSVKKCIKSIFAQDYTNLEIIIVNDGSTDNSEEIIKSVIEEYGRKDVIYIYKENTGVADTRNYAISIASGDYITFIDQDDMYSENYCSSYMGLVHENTDIVVGGYIRVDSEEKELYREHLAEAEWSKYIVTAPWAHIYKREFLVNNKIEFLKSAIGEDVYFNILAYAYAKNVKICEEELYYWANNPESVSNSKQAKIDENIDPLFLLQSIYDRMPEVSGKKKEFIEYYFIRYIVWYILFTLKNSEWKKVREKKKEMFNWLETKFPYYRKNPNIKMGLPKGDSLRNRLSVCGIIRLNTLRADNLFLKILKIVL